MSCNLYNLLYDHFSHYPTATAIESPERGSFSYDDLLKETGRYAKWFYSLRIQPGDRVAVKVEKSPELIFLYLACLKSGAVYLPLNNAYPPAEVRYFLEDAEPRIFVCDPAEFEILQPLTSELGILIFSLGAGGNGSLTKELGGSDNRPPVSRKGGDLASILYTSGTTGRSKGAMITHANLASNALTLHKAWGFVQGDVLIHALPIYHVHGLFVALHCALLNASKIIFLTRFEASEVIRMLPQASVFMGVPTYYTRLLAETSLDVSVCSSMRLFVSGSAPLLQETFEIFRERTGHTILERYGMTEAGMICSNPLKGERRAGTVGFSLSGISVRVCDAKGNELTNGAIGTLEISGPNVFKGYWKLPDRTKRDFRKDGYFITGDLAQIDERAYVSIVGRAKDLIISGGLNVYPKEIELKLDCLDDVKESAVFGLPHHDYGEAVTAVVVSSQGTVFDETELLDQLRKQTASFKIPKRILRVAQLPRNSMGKVQKNLLRGRYRDLFQIKS